MIFLYCASATFASRAKVLTDSIRKYHPSDYIYHMDIEDGPLGQYLPNMAKQRLIKALDLLNTTSEDVIVIGADCELFAPIRFLYDEDVLLVPHIKSPIQDRKYMCQIYETGHANADLIFFSNTHNSKNILKWLISVTEDGKKPGEFYEQTWLSSLPFLFDSVKVIRYPEYNVGYWDVNHIEITKKDDIYMIDGHPLVMFQYSGYLKGQPERMSRHSKEECKNPIALEIYKEYDRKITE